MYPFINHFLPEDFPVGILAFINWVILAHCLALAFFIVGLAKDFIIGAPTKKEVKKTQ